ncbi:MAG TPA: hypothetical protein DCL21_01730 [Alphaproteobacteria bacterium]|nr:hypothetical protein [Alphaproteobacteria bacterium]
MSEESKIQVISVEFLRNSCQEAVKKVNSTWKYISSFDSESQDELKVYNAIAAAIANAKNIMEMQSRILEATQCHHVANNILAGQVAIEQFKSELREKGFGKAELEFGVL